jgi:hypothetical protein
MNVSLWQASGHFPVQAPFHPASPFPGYPYPETSSQPNYVNEVVRELFNLHGFDSANFGLASWDPPQQENLSLPGPAEPVACNISNT